MPLLKIKMQILFHICCAPCALHCFPRLKKEFDDIFGFWYNPNIHPLQEYRRRLNSVKEWAEKTNTRVIYEDKYELQDFLRGIAFRESNRCQICYYLRLKKTAIFARRGKFDFFGSTLLCSPHQNQDLIRNIAREIGEEYSINPYLKSFREGWKESKEVSREMDLYHQQYCGCIYSEAERFK